MNLETTQIGPFSPTVSTIIEPDVSIYSLDTTSSGNTMLTNISEESLVASWNSLSDDEASQMWGEHVTMTALNADGSDTSLLYNRRSEGFAIHGGHSRGQIDYDPTYQSSETVTLSFDKLVQSAEVGLGRMSVHSWQGYPETGAWTAYDAMGNVVAEGNLDPTEGISLGDNRYQFDIEADTPFSQLTIEATPYGNGAAPERSDRNSSFVLQSLSYVAGDPLTSDPTPNPTPDPTPEPEAPQATNDLFNVVQWSSSNELDVLANDTDPDSDSPPTITAVSTPAQGGTLSVSAEGDRILYTPADGFSGNETFEYTITDESGLTDTASVNVTVTAVEPDPGSDPGDPSTPPAADPGDDMPDDDMNMGSAATATGSGLNLWSDPDTWGGTIPQINADVVIPDGVSVVLDVDTPNLEGVTVNGSLIFSETSEDLLEFTADWLLVNGGTLQIGTEANPFDEADALITLDGEDIDVMDMGMGGRFLIVNNGGTLDMHGDVGNGVSWTQLSAHANPGDQTIHLAESVGWQVGDEIVIAPSGFDVYESETRTITGVSADGTQVTLDQPLSHEHWGTIESVDGKPLDMRAEVGLLSRNIKITSSEDSVTSEFGFHAMFMEDTDVRISGVELYRGGQIGKPGRYPIHWHLAGDATDDYIENSSIHNSFQRGIVAHGTSNLMVDSNVVYDVFSHAYIFSEDGTEWNNTFNNNLGLLTKRRNQADFSFFHEPASGNSSQNENRPSVFWGRNYYNPLIGNHAAGTEDGNGFFYDLKFTPFRVQRDIISSTEQIVFRDNVAHSNGTRFTTSLANYSPITSGHGLFLELYGTQEGTEVIFEDFTAYKNENSGAWLENERHVLDGAVLADNSTGAIIRSSTVRNTVIDQQSPNDIGGVLGVDRSILSGSDLGGGVHILFSTAPFVSNPTIQNVTFQNIQPAAITIDRDTRLGNNATVSGLKIENSPAFYWYRDLVQPNTRTNNLIDLDGSLTGLPSTLSGPSVALDSEYFDPEFNAFVVPA